MAVHRTRIDLSHQAIADKKWAENYEILRSFLRQTLGLAENNPVGFQGSGWHSFNGEIYFRNYPPGPVARARSILFMFDQLPPNDINHYIMRILMLDGLEDSAYDRHELTRSMAAEAERYVKP